MTLVRKSTESTSSSSSTKTLPRPVSFVKKFHKCGRESRRAAEREQQARVSAYLERNHFREINEPQQPKGCLLWRAETMYPLHHAVRENNYEMVRLLLASGADPCQRSSKGRTPAQLAKDLGVAERIIEQLETSASSGPKLSLRKAMELSRSEQGQLVEVHL